jgi:hypothetical protein
MANEKAKEFWGGALAVASLAPALIAGAVHGAYNAISGEGTFSEGFNETADKIVEGAEEFGTEHADDLTNAVVTTAKAVVTGVIVRQIPTGHPHTPHTPNQS